MFGAVLGPRGTRVLRDPVRRPVLLALVLLALAPTTVEADRIHLKSGQDFEVDRWWEQGGALYYERLGGIVAVPRGDVERIERSPAPGSASPSTPAPPAAAPLSPAAPRPCDPFEPLVTRGAVPCGSPRPDPCEVRFPKVGYPETAIYAWAACRGYTTASGQILSPDLFVVTVTAAPGFTHKRFVAGPDRDRRHVYTQNGTITAIQIQP